MTIFPFATKIGRRSRVGSAIIDPTASFLVGSFLSQRCSLYDLARVLRNPARGLEPIKRVSSSAVKGSLKKSRISRPTPRSCKKLLALTHEVQVNLP